MEASIARQMLCLARSAMGTGGLSKFDARRKAVDSFKGLPFPVRLGDAGARGRGVFATRGVKRGQVLTLYPCHMLRVRAPPDFRPEFIATRPVAEEEAAALQTHCQFIGEDMDGRLFEVVGDPTHEFEPHACGHLINDPRTVDDHEAAAAGAANCEFDSFVGMGVLCVATRDIDEGEELLAPYGYACWFKTQFVA